MTISNSTWNGGSARVGNDYGGYSGMRTLLDCRATLQSIIGGGEGVYQIVPLNGAVNRAVQANSSKMALMKNLVYTLLAALVCITAAPAAEPKSLDDKQFQEQFRRFSAERDDSGRQRHAREMLGAHYLTSLQVKAIAQSLRNDDARLEFALLAYARTVDPENFYEVYDAFTTISKVMRLHDRIRPLERPAPPVVRLPRVLSDDEFKDILQSLRRESLENTRSQVARQIVTSSRSLFRSSQVKQMVQCFSFDSSKLEFAKLAYEFTFDKEKYFLVNEAFDFDSSRQNLARHIDSWNREHPPRQ